MTPEIQQQLIDWLKSLGNLAAQELPVFVQEVATYGFVKGIIFSIMLFIAIVFLLYTIKNSVKKCEDNEIRNSDNYKEMSIKNDKQAIGIFITIISIIALIPCVICLPVNLHTAIKAKCAPRLYVIERLTK